MPRPRKSSLERKVEKLRARGWSEAKIERWLNERGSVQAREARIHPPPPWSDTSTAHLTEQLFAKYGAEPFDYFDQSTALAIIDDAEKAGLVLFPGDLYRVSRHSITEIPLEIRIDEQWEKLAHDSYEAGGKAGVVAAAAHATREFIRDGFPYGYDAMSFWVYD